MRPLDVTASLSTTRDPVAPPRFSEVEFVRYFVCSAIALGADVLVFTLVLRLGLGYATAGAAGFIVGLSVAYTLSVRFVFRHRRMRDERAEFVVFAGIGLAGLLLTQAILWWLIERLALDARWAKLLSACVVFGFNFAGRKAILFTQRRRASA